MSHSHITYEIKTKGERDKDTQRELQWRKQLEVVNQSNRAGVLEQHISLGLRKGEITLVNTSEKKIPSKENKYKTAKI